jgi:translation initiation factor 3 subunit D
MALKHFSAEVGINSLQAVADPIMQKLAKEDAADIFTTDVALAALMTAPKAQFAWDISIRKFKNLIFIDKRDKENILDW